MKRHYINCIVSIFRAVSIILHVAVEDIDHLSYIAKVAVGPETERGDSD